MKANWDDESEEEDVDVQLTKPAKPVELAGPVEPVEAAVGEVESENESEEGSGSSSDDEDEESGMEDDLTPFESVQKRIEVSWVSVV